MTRRTAYVAPCILAFAGGWLIGNAPDRELRTEAHRLADATGRLAQSCEGVVVENIRLSRRPAQRAGALGQ